MRLAFALVLFLAGPLGAADPRPSTVVVAYQKGPAGGEGSGTVVAAEGGRVLVLTNRHVCPDPGTAITVRAGGRAYRADWLGADPVADLAALAVTADLPAAELAPDDPPAGTPLRHFGRTTGPQAGWHVDAALMDNVPTGRARLHSASGDSGAGLFGPDDKLVAVMWGGTVEAEPYNLSVRLSEIRRFLARVRPRLSLTAPKVEVLTYDEGAEKARRAGRPLVTWVGLTPAAARDEFVTAWAPALDGFRPGQVVVSAWLDGRHLGVAVEAAAFDPTHVPALVARIQGVAR